MNEEKRLDEQALEGVTGGAAATANKVLEAERFYKQFSQNFCGKCSKNHFGCPYHDNSLTIYLELRSSGTCLSFREGFPPEKR